VKQPTSVRKGEAWETYDLTTGEPCPAVLTVVDARAGRVWLMVEAGVGIRVVRCATLTRPPCTPQSSTGEAGRLAS
jgi:hypothetical protein